MSARPPAKAAKRIRWQRLLWLTAVTLGLICCGITWAAQDGLLRVRFYPLLQLQGLIYDQGMTEYALRRNPPQLPVAVVQISGVTRQLFEEVPGFPPFKREKLGYRRESRALHTRLLRNLNRLGARVVVFDLVFDEDEPEFDPEFAKAIREHGKVVLAAANDSGREADGRAERLLYLRPPNATLREAAAAYAVANLPEDPDRTLRRFPWWGMGVDENTLEDTRVPSLAAAGAALFTGRDARAALEQEVVPHNTFGGKPIVGFGDRSGDFYASYIRYFGAQGSPAGLRSLVNYEDVCLVGEDPKVDAAALRAQISGKLVLVGETSDVGQDIHRSPVLTPGEALDAGANMPGVEIQAHATQTVLSGLYPREAGDAARFLLLLTACLAMALIARILTPLPAAFLGLIGVAALVFGSIHLFASTGVWLEPVTAVAGLVTTTITGSGLMYILEHRERLAMRRQLSRQVGEAVAAQLTEGDWPDRGGETVEITVMFSDLQGFTSLSETMSSSELCDVLNRYFGDVIFPLVDRYGGSTDKLMGDGMMAYFGWPARHADHARRAVLCALDMERELVKWLELPENAGLPALRTRIGLHTGVATVGEIGSGKRVEFTVIGDVVNTSARLESMNKEFGSVILMSEPTRSAAGDIGVRTWERGAVAVRGKVEPIPVHSIQLEDITGQVAEGRAAEPGSAEPGSGGRK